MLNFSHLHVCDRFYAVKKQCVALRDYLANLRACLKSTICKVRTAHLTKLCEKETEF